MIIDLFLQKDAGPLGNRDDPDRRQNDRGETLLQLLEVSSDPLESQTDRRTSIAYVMLLGQSAQLAIYTGSRPVRGQVIRLPCPDQKLRLTQRVQSATRPSAPANQNLKVRGTLN